MSPTPVNAGVEECVQACRALSHGSVLAVSGFGGAGKTTLAKKLSAEVGDTAVVHGDDFTVGRARGRSSDWASIDRLRLRQQVLEPYKAHGTARYQRYDWSIDAPGPWIDVDGATRIIVEGIGLFHPDLFPLYDFRIWIDCPLEVATARGSARDAALGAAHAERWRNEWGPNDADFFDRFRSRDEADIVCAADAQHDGWPPGSLRR